MGQRFSSTSGLSPFTHSDHCDEVLEELTINIPFPNSSTDPTEAQSATTTKDEDAFLSINEISVVSISWMESQRSIVQILQQQHHQQQRSYHRLRFERLFLNCPPLQMFDPIRTFAGCYRHTGEWTVCRVRSYDCDGTFTIVWEDGTLQIGTKISHELKRFPEEWSRRLDECIAQQAAEQQNQNNNNKCQGNQPSRMDLKINKANYQRQSEQPLLRLREPPTHNGFTVWEAAKKGDLETVLTLIDRGDATPNSVEILQQQNSNSSNVGGGEEQNDGRSPLYWACFGGHVELVRELLARGGMDSDGAAYLAVTSRERANDDRDLLFDPDTNTFSDWVDYPVADANNENERVKSQGRDPKTHEQFRENREDDAALIRAMLAAASATPAKRRHDMKSMRLRLPQRLYNSMGKNSDDKDGSSCSKRLECVVCLNQATPSNRRRVQPLEEEEGIVEEKVVNGRADDFSEARIVSLSIAVPCGHICACQTCLQLIRKRGDGCPICRSAISAIVPHRT